MRRRLRLPNGFGRIAKLNTPRLRNCYRAMVTTGINERGYATKIIGYFPTYNSAYDALVRYHSADSLRELYTVEELYEEWLPIASEENGWSRSYIMVMKNAWNYCTLRERGVASILPRDLRSNILSDGIPPQMRIKLKNLYNSLFRYAVSESIIEHSPAVDVKIPKVLARELKDSVKKKSVFTEDEIRRLAEIGDVMADMALYQIYSGWRMAELTSIRKVDVNLTMGFIVGGCKTDAGKNRMVPIHPAIRHLVSKYLKSEGEMLFPLDYYYYNNHFKKYMQSVGMEHTSHDCRKTFITMSKSGGMDEYALKRIVGHSITDITESIYTERPVSFLQSEMAKVPDVIHDAKKNMAL